MATKWMNRWHDAFMKISQYKKKRNTFIKTELELHFSMDTFSINRFLITIYVYPFRQKIIILLLDWRVPLFVYLCWSVDRKINFRHFHIFLSLFVFAIQTKHMVAHFTWLLWMNSLLQTKWKSNNNFKFDFPTFRKIKLDKKT